MLLCLPIRPQWAPFAVNSNKHASNQVQIQPQNTHTQRGSIASALHIRLQSSMLHFCIFICRDGIAIEQRVEQKSFAIFCFEHPKCNTDKSAWREWKYKKKMLRIETKAKNNIEDAKQSVWREILWKLPKLPSYWNKNYVCTAMRNVKYYVGWLVCWRRNGRKGIEAFDKQFNHLAVWCFLLYSMFFYFLFFFLLLLLFQIARWTLNVCAEFMCNGIAIRSMAINWF